MLDILMISSISLLCMSNWIQSCLMSSRFFENASNRNLTHHAYTHIRAHICTHTRTRNMSCIHICTCIHTRTHNISCINIYIYVHVHAYTHAQATYHAYVYIRACKHVHATYHIYICMHTRGRNISCNLSLASASSIMVQSAMPTVAPRHRAADREYFGHQSHKKSIKPLYANSNNFLNSFLHEAKE